MLLCAWPPIQGVGGQVKETLLWGPLTVPPGLATWYPA